jgi:hypothetical protein
MNNSDPAPTLRPTRIDLPPEIGSALQVMRCPEYVAKSSVDSAYCRLTFARQHYLDTTTGGRRRVSHVRRISFGHAKDFLRSVLVISFCEIQRFPPRVQVPLVIQLWST